MKTQYRVMANLVIGSVVFALAYWVALNYLHSVEGKQSYLKQYYAPAVMIAQGKGFVNPDLAQAPALNEFIRMQVDSLDTAQIPDTLQLLPLSQYQLLHRHSMYALGWTWWFFGLHWDSIYYLQALLFALSTVALLTLFSQFLPGWMSFFFTLFMIWSPLQLYAIADFRDYSKAPFILGTLALMTFLIVRQRKFPVALSVAALVGIILGIGMGFRQDLLICIPLYVAQLLLFYPVAIRQSWKIRVLLIVVLVSAWGLCAAPLFSTMKNGTSSYHFIAQGMASNFNRDLQLGGAAYQLLDEYSDERAHTMISAYAHHGMGVAQGPTYWTNAYDRSGATFTLDVYKLMPADEFIRGLAATSDILSRAPFVLERNSGPVFVKGSLIDRLLQWRWAWLGWMYNRGLYIAVLAFLMLAFINVRWAFAALVTTLYLCAYQHFQFNVRHFFFLEWIPWLCLVLVIYLSIRSVLLWMKVKRKTVAEAEGEHHFSSVQLRCIKTSLATFFVLAVFMLAWAVTTFIQHKTVGTHLQRYAQAKRSALQGKVTAINNVPVIEVLDFLNPDNVTEHEKNIRVQTGMLVGEFKAETFPYTVELMYEAESPTNRFNKTITIPPASFENATSYTCYFPVYNTTDNYFGQGQRHFQGLSIQGTDPTVLLSLNAVNDLAPLTPFLTVRLPDNNPERATKRLSFHGQTRVPNLRSWESYTRNLFPNGDFEYWDGGELAGERLSLQLQAIVEQDTENIAHGNHALLQRWTASDASQSALEQFGVLSEPLDSSRMYELFVKGWNPGQGTAQVSLWQATMGTSGQWDIVPLMINRFNVTKSAGYQEYSTRFGLYPKEGETRLLVTSSMNGVSYPATVYWDAWRLTEYEEDFDL